MSLRFLADVAGLADPAPEVQSNLELIESWLFGMSPSKVSGVATTLNGPPTNGTWVIGDVWTDASRGRWRCTVAGTPGTWVMVFPGFGTAYPSSPATGYVFVRTDLHYSPFNWDGAAWVPACTSDALEFKGVVTPTALSGHTDDWNPGTLGTKTIVRVSSSAAYELRGIAGGAEGKTMFLLNVGNYTITIPTEAATSTAGNRFVSPAAVAFEPNSMLIAQYDATSSRWRIAGGSSSAIAGGPFAIRGDITPTALAADVNDYNPTGFATANIVRLSCSGATRIITGMQAGTAWEVKILVNVSASAAHYITLAFQSASSAAANRFATETHSVIRALGGMALCIYDPNQARWLVLNSSTSNLGNDLGNYYPFGTVIGSHYTGFNFASVVTPSSISGTVNNWAPGITSRNWLRIAATADARVTGITEFTNGKFVLVHNISSYNVTLGKEDAGSTAQYRFAAGADYRLPPDGVAIIHYDTTSGRWRILGGSGGFVTTESMWIPAGAMKPATTNGAQWSLAESATNKVMVENLDFDPSTNEYAQFCIRMPKRWNQSTITVAFAWGCNNANTNNVVLGAQAAAVRDGDSYDVAWGTAQTVTDAHSNSTAKVNVTGQTAAITIGGTIGQECLVFVRIYRDAANGSDTVAQDAQLHGVTVYWGAATNTDA